jgi:S1-C subfamily serine protease
MSSQPTDLNLAKQINTTSELQNRLNRLKKLHPELVKSTNKSAVSQRVEKIVARRERTLHIFRLLTWLSLTTFLVVILLSLNLWINPPGFKSNKLNPSKLTDTSLEKIRLSVVKIQREITAEQIKKLKSQISSSTNRQDLENIQNYPDTGSYWQLLGAGVAVKPNLILTAKHLVASNATYQIETIAGQTWLVKREAIHPFEDLALLKVLDEGKTLPPLQLANSLVPNQNVWTLGYPLGLNQNLSQGIVSSTELRIESQYDTFLSNFLTPSNLRQAQILDTEQNKIELINRLHSQGQTDIFLHTSQINYGSSGGPVVNDQGELVGITSFSLNKSDTTTYFLSQPNKPDPSPKDLQSRVSKGFTPGTDFIFNGSVGFKAIARFLETYKHNQQFAYLEGYGQTLTPGVASFYGLPRDHGWWLQDLRNDLYQIHEPGVWAGGNLAQANLKTGDIIFALNDQDLNQTQSLGEILLTLKPGQEVLVKYARLDNGIWINSQTTVKMAGQQLWTDQDLKQMKLGQLSL